MAQQDGNFILIMTLSTGAYEYALDNQPGLDIFPDETWTRHTYESRLRGIGDEVFVAYTLQTLLINGVYHNSCS